MGEQNGACSKGAEGAYLSTLFHAVSASSLPLTAGESKVIPQPWCVFNVYYMYLTSIVGCGNKS